MVFGFLKKDKQKKNSSSKKSNVNSNATFWQKCVEEKYEIGSDGSKPKKSIKPPYSDMCKNFINEDYLKDILKNDSDIHRRGFALYLLKTFCSLKSDSDNLDDYLSNLIDEMNLPDYEWDIIIKDYGEFCDAAANNNLDLTG